MSQKKIHRLNYEEIMDEKQRKYVRGKCDTIKNSTIHVNGISEGEAEIEVEAVFEDIVARIL